MIFPSEYAPFSSLLEAWTDRMELTQVQSENMADADWLPVRDFLNDLREQIPANVIGPDWSCNRIDNSVFEKFDSDDLEANFPEFESYLSSWWEIIGDGDLDDSIELDEVSEFFKLPSLKGYRFLHFNPTLSTVDTRGMDFVRDLLRRSYSSAEHEFLEKAIIDPDAPVLEQLNIKQYSRLIMLRDIYADFGSVLNSPVEFGFDQYNGQSICFEVSAIKSYLDNNYPLEESNLVRLVNAERQAERAFRAHLEKNPKRIKSADARRLFCAELGTRAARRVWDNVAKDYPVLKTPGRHKKDT